MQQSNVLSRQDVHSLECFHVTYFNEVRFKGKNVRLVDSKRLRSSFPKYNTLLIWHPTVSVDVKREF